jgi:hypothetical protein
MALAENLTEDGQGSSNKGLGINRANQQRLDAPQTVVIDNNNTSPHRVGRRRPRTLEAVSVAP